MKKICKTMATAIAISTAMASTVMAGEWKEEAGNWYYIKDDGSKASSWEQVNDVWYYFDANTNVMKTGWLDVGGSRYFLGTDGAMRTGLFDTLAYNGDLHQYEAYADGRLMVNVLEDENELLTGAAYWHKEDGTILYKTTNTEKLQNMWKELFVGDFQQEQISDQKSEMRDRINDAKDALTERYYEKVYTARTAKSWLKRLEEWEKSATRKLTEAGATEEEINGYIADIKAGRYDEDYEEEYSTSYYYEVTYDEYDDDYDYDE